MKTLNYKEAKTVKEKKRDKDIVQDAIGDPAFYNDQIGENNIPGREVSEDKKNGMRKKGKR